MRKVSTIIASALLAAAPALAGINPASPGLPTADTTNNLGNSTYTGFTAPNNASSSMCVDCHTVQPKAGGSHYVNATATVGATNSGGSGIVGGVPGAGRDNGAYFKASIWTTNTTGGAVFSKYGNGATGSVSTNNTVPGTKNSTQVAANALAGYDIICESCHNIVANEAGGNNLVDTQAGNEFWNAAEAEICIGCHGFMYTTSAANAGNANYTDARNVNEVAGGNKDNNEVHWVKGTMAPQNHHVMTGDTINATVAGAMLLWTDNNVVHYTAPTILNAGASETRGTLPQRATWQFPVGVNAVKPTAGQVTCTNCHTPAHGVDGSPAASILRNATYSAGIPGGLGPIARISDRMAWKKIDDLTYCTQCHVGL